MRTTVLVFLICSLIGCASTHMQQYMGKDIREVILDSGSPINALDMGNGVRAFQFRWGGGTFSIPQTTTTTGTVTSYGNTAWLNSSSITSAGGTFTSEGCVITYMATWSESTQTWIVSSYRIPKQLVC